MSALWETLRHPINTIDRKITEAQTCPGCGCEPHEWRADCDCLRQGCVCAGAEEDDDPDWEREAGPDAATVDAAGRNDGLPPAASPHEPQRKRPQKTTPPPGGTTAGSTGGTGTPAVHDRRTGRWYDDKPITSTNTASTGGSMVGIDEARAVIMAGIEKENEGLGAMQSAHASLEEAQNMLLQGTQGSNQGKADQAHAQLADAMSKIDEACQQVASTLQEFESVAQRL